MKRRSFLKAVGLTAGTLAGASCVPKGEVMPQIGDLFAKLALGQQLTSGEIEQLRLGMNQQQNATSRLSALLTPSGNLDPNIFSHHSGEFSVLPHIASGMAKSSNQEIPDVTGTQIKPFDQESELESNRKMFSYEYGIKRDLTNGEFIVPGTKNAVYLFYGYATLTVVGGVDYSHCYVYEKGGGNWFYLGSASSPATGNEAHGCAFVQSLPAESAWQFYVYHGSGAAATLTEAWWSVARLR